MTHTFSETILALAGIIQATKLVQEIASHGTVDQANFEVCIHSLFETNPRDTASVYGGVEGVRPGLIVLTEQLGEQQHKRDMEITKYVISVMHLEKKLSKRPDMLKTIGQGIDKAREQAGHFSMTHENVIANLADLYVNTISTLQPRIIVNGEHGYLTDPDNANKIRALLLAAIRSAVLWRQCGGNRLQLLLNRKKIIQMAGSLLRTQ